jgi:hypothetical protein
MAASEWRDIDIVVAGHDADIARRAERRHLAGGKRIFRRKADVDEIADQRDVIGGVRGNVGDDRVQRVHVVDIVAMTVPVPVSGEAFAHQFAPMQPKAAGRHADPKGGRG